MAAGRAYGFSKVVADMGKLSPAEKSELMTYMDQLETVCRRQHLITCDRALIPLCRTNKKSPGWALPMLLRVLPLWQHMLAKSLSTLITETRQEVQTRNSAHLQHLAYTRIFHLDICVCRSTVQSFIAASVFLDTLNFFKKDLGEKGAPLLDEVYHAH